MDFVRAFLGFVVVFLLEKMCTLCIMLLFDALCCTTEVVVILSIRGLFGDSVVKMSSCMAEQLHRLILP